MDKLNYKQMLADEMSIINELRNEIEDLNKVISLLQEKNINLTYDSLSLQTIKRMVKKHSNDMDLGGKIRHAVLQLEVDVDTNQLNLFKDN